MGLFRTATARFQFDPRTGQKIDCTPTLGGWDLTITLEPPERANKMLIEQIDSGNPYKKRQLQKRETTERSLTPKGCENHGTRSFQAARFQPVRPENKTILRTSVGTDGQENPDELGESGGMRARPQPRKLRRRKLRLI